MGDEGLISHPRIVSRAREQGECQRETSVQLLVTAGLPKELIESGVQALSLHLTRMVSVERPEILGKLLEEVEMGQEVWDQFRGTWRYSWIQHRASWAVKLLN
jgi:hypothetical protein